MSDQQMTGVATLIISAGVAWTLSRLSRTRPVEGISFITLVCFLQFLVGIVLCYFGVTNIVEGSV